MVHSGAQSGDQNEWNRPFPPLFERLRQKAEGRVRTRDSPVKLVQPIASTMIAEEMVKWQTTERPLNLPP
jgi:hypothetical protein